MNHKKLLNSKWTACSPHNKEKHFIVIEVETHPDNGKIIHITIEAVMSKKTYDIDWRELSDTSQWIRGWK
ncbi:MAG: TIGR02450 family Trp-rich protein [Gammaproteobacteria bacterium]|nr:TIGR02450 family Trp-rich protein [Gammaproteobacteria bacterium]